MRKFSFCTFLVLSSLLIADMLLYYFFKISLAGYYSDVILFWLWLIFSIAMIILFWKKLLAKLFLFSFILAMVVSFIAMLIPFFALLLPMTSAGLYQEKTLNENYRAQIVRYDAMARPRLEIIKENGLIEKRVFLIDDFNIDSDYPNLRISEAKSINFISENDSTIILSLIYGGPNITIKIFKKSGVIMAVNKGEK